MKKQIIQTLILIVFVTNSCLSAQVESLTEPQLLQLDYATFLGGSGDDRAQGVVADEDGNLYITAPIESGDFPITPDALVKEPTGIYLAKLNPKGIVVYATYIGVPGGANYTHDIALDKEGCVYLAGNTTNPDFPVTPGAFQTTFYGPTDAFHGDAFVIKLNPDCSKIIYATFLGGSGKDLCGKIAVDDEGNAYVVGSTSSVDFPVTEGAFDTSFNGGNGDGRDDLFVAKLNPAGNELIYCTYIGGSETELYGYNLLVDEKGSVVFAGTTASDDFPTTVNAFDRDYNGGSGERGKGDAFLVKLNPEGSMLMYASYIGGSGEDCANNIAIDREGYAWIAGETNSPDFPVTSNAWEQRNKGGIDGFFACINLEGGALRYASLLGGKATDSALIAVHSSGLIILAGRTESSDFPVTSTPTIIANEGNVDIFITLIDPETNELKSSSLLGGTGHEAVFSLICERDQLYMVGNTTSADFPVTSNAWDNTFNGGATPWGGDALILHYTLFDRIADVSRSFCP